MHIFIDESGAFVPADGQDSVSLVAALVFSQRGLERFHRDYQSLRRRLPKENGEVKGRLLSETHVRRVVRLLRRSGCLLEVIASDTAVQTTEEIADHQSMHAEKLTENLTDEHPPNIHETAGKWRKRLEELAPQLYVQSVVMTELVYSVLKHANVFLPSGSRRSLANTAGLLMQKGETGSLTGNYGGPKSSCK